MWCSAVAVVYLSVYQNICLSICPSFYLSIYLSFFLSIHPSIHLSLYLSVRLSIYLSICKLENEAILWDFLSFWTWQHQKRSNSARLPQFSTLARAKTKQFCETSSFFDGDNIKNEAILRDIIQKSKVECRAQGLVPMRLAIFPVHVSAKSYEVLHLPLSTFHSTLHTSHLTLHTLHSTLHTSHSKLYTSHSTLSIPQSTLSTPHSALSTPTFSLYTPHSPRQTPDPTL